MTAVNLAEKSSMSSEHWSPKIVSSCNGYDVVLVKADGKFTWHSHPDTDDFSIVLSG